MAWISTATRLWVATSGNASWRRATTSKRDASSGLQRGRRRSGGLPDEHSVFLAKLSSHAQKPLERKRQLDLRSDRGQTAPQASTNCHCCLCSKRLIRCFERGANPAVQRLFPQFLHKSPRANAIAYQSFQDVTWKTIVGLTGRSDALHDSALRHVSKSQSQLGPGFFMQPLSKAGWFCFFDISLGGMS